MDDATFDPSAANPGIETSRRRLLGGLVGGTLAGVVGWRETEADPKRRNERDNKSQKRRRGQDGDVRRVEGESTQNGDSPALKVLTRNLYLGADLAPIFTPQPQDAFLKAVGQVFSMVQSTNFPERAKALADEIAAIRPHLVGMQEVTLWRSQTPADFKLNATHREYDFRAILLKELAARGQAYDVVADVENTDAEAPGLTAGGLRDFRLTDQDVLLARTDLPKNVFDVGGRESGTFKARLTLQIAGVPLDILRGWTKVDVSLHGETMRIVNTHLEPDNLDIQEEQGAQLVRGPLNTPLPTVLLGDLNSPAPDGGTYKAMLGAGFEDAWMSTGGTEAGFTWGHAADLRNPEPTLTQRIDFVLTRGGITASSANRVGHEREDRTPSGLWPSDHAGVWAVLHLKNG
jgi:hypothetical protein